MLDPASTRFHVVTQPGDAYTDTWVEVFRGDTTTSLGGPSDDNGGHEDWFSDAIPAVGDYYVKVYNSRYVTVFNAAYRHYDLLVTLE